jgi:hypothetical protein
VTSAPSPYSSVSLRLSISNAVSVMSTPSSLDYQAVYGPANAFQVLFIYWSSPWLFNKILISFRCKQGDDMAWSVTSHVRDRSRCSVASTDWNVAYNSDARNVTITMTVSVNKTCVKKESFFYEIREEMTQKSDKETHVSTETF